MVTKSILVANRYQMTISTRMKQDKILAGSPFPKIAVDGLEGRTEDIGKPRGGAEWKMVVVYGARVAET